MINNWLIYLKVSYLRQYVFVCSCLTPATTTVISSAWCPYLTSWKIASIVASCVTWLVILSILLARKRTLEFYAEQLITVKTKKEDQEKVLRMPSQEFARNEMMFLVIQLWSACKELLLIYTLQMEGTNLFSLSEIQAIICFKIMPPMILTANFMHNHKFACFSHLFSPCPLKLLCFYLNSTLRTCCSFCNSYI